MHRIFALLLAASALAATPSRAEEPGRPVRTPDPAQGREPGKADTLRLGLQDCLRIALERNRMRPVSKLGLDIAEAQRRQALSSYWPQVGLRSAFVQNSMDLVDIFPEETASYVINGVFPQPLQARVTVPEKRVKLMDRTVSLTTVDLTLPVYTAGKRGAIVRQAEAGVEAARQEIRRTDLQVIYDVKRMYYAGVLAREVMRLGRETLGRLEVTLELTESLYKKGSGKVKKTDYLRNKVVVESVRSLVATLEGKAQVVDAALANAMGLDRGTRVEPSEEEIPLLPMEGGLEDLVSRACRTNPEWARLGAGLRAASAKVAEARSGYLPKAAILGNFTHIGNAYDKGLVGPGAKRTWKVGVGVEAPLFNGFLTRNQVRESKARLDRMERLRPVLQEGLALQVEVLFREMKATQAQEKAAGEALRTAEENLDLTTRAYQDDLVEVKELIESQLMEAFVRAQYLKVRYDHYEHRAQLDAVIGEGVE